MKRACLRESSTQVTAPAPRLKHSRPSAPVPPNNSSTRAPATRPPNRLNTACRTKSGVGRTPKPWGALSIKPAASPPIMRMGSRAGEKRSEGEKPHDLGFSLEQNLERVALETHVQRRPLLVMLPEHTAIAGVQAAHPNVRRNFEDTLQVRQRIVVMRILPLMRFHGVYNLPSHVAHQPIVLRPPQRLARLRIDLEHQRQDFVRHIDLARILHVVRRGRGGVDVERALWIE